MKPEKIKEARKEAGKTQLDLAAFLGLNRVTISKYENGEIIPTIEQMEKIAHFCDKDISFFLDDKENENIILDYFHPGGAAYLTDLFDHAGINYKVIEYFEKYELTIDDKTVSITNTELVQLREFIEKFTKLLITEYIDGQRIL